MEPTAVTDCIHSETQRTVKASMFVFGSCLWAVQCSIGSTKTNTRLLPCLTVLLARTTVFNEHCSSCYTIGRKYNNIIIIFIIIIIDNKNNNNTINNKKNRKFLLQIQLLSQGSMKHLLTKTRRCAQCCSWQRNIWMTNTDGLMGWCQMQMLQEELVRLTYQGVIL